MYPCTDTVIWRAKSHFPKPQLCSRLPAPDSRRIAKFARDEVSHTTRQAQAPPRAVQAVARTFARSIPASRVRPAGSLPPRVQNQSLGHVEVRESENCRPNSRNNANGALPPVSKSLRRAPALRQLADRPKAVTTRTTTPSADSRPLCVSELPACSLGVPERLVPLDRIRKRDQRFLDTKRDTSREIPIE